MSKNVLLIVILCCCSGCLRFVPSAGGLYGTKSITGLNPAEYVNDEEVFNLPNELQKQRLTKLVSFRKKQQQTFIDKAYHVGPEDQLQFQVFDIPELNLITRVRQNGYVTLPLIGEFFASGKTEDELEKEIAIKLSEYVYDPQVNIFVQEYASKKVSVIGQVADPGSFPIKRDAASLIQLISEAGGRTDGSSGNVILIPKDADQIFAGEQLTYAGGINYGIEIPYEELIGKGGKPATDVPVFPGDTVVVQEAGVINIDGEVNLPGTVQPKNRMTLLGAIAAAGGLTYSANIDEVEIYRDLGNNTKAYVKVNLENVAFKSGQDIRLRDGDFVRVPSSASLYLARQAIDVFNRFINFSLRGNVEIAQ